MMDAKDFTAAFLYGVLCLGRLGLAFLTFHGYKLTANLDKRQTKFSEYR